VCPRCGRENSPSFIECPDCKERDALEQAQAEPEVHAAAPVPQPIPVAPYQAPYQPSQQTQDWQTTYIAPQPQAPQQPVYNQAPQQPQYVQQPQYQPPPQYAPQQPPQQAPQYALPPQQPPQQYAQPPQYAPQPQQYAQPPQYAPQQLPVPQYAPPQQQQPQYAPQQPQYAQTQPVYLPQSPQQYAPPQQQYTPPAVPVAAPAPAPKPAPAPVPEPRITKPVSVPRTPVAPPEPPPGLAAKLGALPTPILMLLFAVVFLVVGAGIYYGYQSFNKPSSGSTQPAAAATKPKVTNPIQKYIEVVGIRLTTDAKKKPVAKFVIVNHASTEVANLGGNVILWASTKRSEEDSVGSFAFHVDSIGPYETKEVSAPFSTKLKMYELPDWQNATPEVQITSPQP